MYQFFVEPEQIDVAAKSVIIRGTDVNHIKNVLRTVSVWSFVLSRKTE